eukprot:CAMPEP_0194370104 /NCGR_PEP_ID=MMETSP0174-20130528/18429_1 /TAXON_ID=216777 /ORGANISM="Proboscia alata, Strain PI-D3" /LENGTH=193 /DNA_ID=CAMNT_0039147399 /DNA_START=3 /DNA_END=581 /DNA_ORIENTATION=+
MSSDNAERRDADERQEEELLEPSFVKAENDDVQEEELLTDDFDLIDSPNATNNNNINTNTVSSSLTTLATTKKAALQKKFQHRQSFLYLLTEEPLTQTQTQNKTRRLKYLTLAAAILTLIERKRQHRLTTAPHVYYQSTPQNQRLASLLSGLLHRELKPSLFVGTRSILNSTLAYAKIGPYNHERFREIIVNG